ncbi:MAG: hypothetical protein ACRDHG_04585 [Anaerolineales bacterium]
MENEEKLPRTSYALIEWLDETVARPDWPPHADGWANLTEGKLRALAFTAGARALADMLVAEMRAENGEEQDAEGPVDGPPVRYARLLGEGRDVHTVELDFDGLDPEPTG